MSEDHQRRATSVRPMPVTSARPSEIESRDSFFRIFRRPVSFISKLGTSVMGLKRSPSV